MIRQSFTYAARFSLVDDPRTPLPVGTIFGLNGTLRSSNFRMDPQQQIALKDLFCKEWLVERAHLVDVCM